jgi:hypothetical protein
MHSTPESKQPIVFSAVLEVTASMLRISAVNDWIETSCILFH